MAGAERRQSTPDFPTIAPDTRRFLHAYVDALHSLGPSVYGVYLLGSLCLGAYEEGRSDIDMMVLTVRGLSQAERSELALLHARLAKDHPLAEKLDALYLPSSEVGKGSREVLPHPVVRDGRFCSAGLGDLNAVSWWLLRHRGIVLFGPPPSDLPIAVDWGDVVAAMHHNLDTYWPGKTAQPLPFLGDAWVEFAISTLCRILATIEDDEIIGKRTALDRGRQRLPSRWQPLIAEAERIRSGASRRLPVVARFHRMVETLAFVRYACRRGRTGIAQPLVVGTEVGTER